MTNNEILQGLRNNNFATVLVNEDANRIELVQTNGVRVTHYAPSDLDCSVAAWFRSEFLLSAGRNLAAEIQIKENGIVSDWDVK